jgi:hypothetical protein
MKNYESVASFMLKSKVMVKKDKNIEIHNVSPLGS